MGERPRILVSSHPPFLSLVRRLAETCEILTFDNHMAKIVQDSAGPEQEVQVAPLGSKLSLEAGDQALCAAAACFRRLKPPSADGLDPGVGSWLKENLFGYFLARLPDLSRLLAGLDEARPDLLLVHNDVEPLLRAAALWARSRARPCLHVPHAIYLPNPERGQRIGDDVHDLVLADRVAAAGPYQETWFQDRYRHWQLPAQIRITGLPQFDQFLKRLQGLPRARARRLFQLKQHRPTVIYASSWSQQTNLLGCHDQVERAYLAFLEAAAQRRWQVIIKVHPHDSRLHWHVEQVKAAGLEAQVTAQHLEAVLAAGDLLIAYGPSNVLLEGALLPWLRLMMIDGHHSLEGIPAVAAQPEAILAASDQLLAKPPADHQPFLLRYLGPVDGQADQRLFEWIQEVLDAGPA